MEGAREGAWDSPYGFGLLVLCAAAVGSTVTWVRGADAALERERGGAGHGAAGSHGLLDVQSISIPFSNTNLTATTHRLIPRSRCLPIRYGEREQRADLVPRIHGRETALELIHHLVPAAASSSSILIATFTP